jgi:RHS repeat-associated protein
MDAVHRYDVSGHKYTGKERDAESGDDYFGARYYASTMGRFLTLDPLFATPLHIVNPQ